MDYVCGPLILYSLDKIRMMDFLSDVLEFEVNPEKDSVENGSLHLQLIELPENQKEKFQSHGIKFAFKLKSQEQIEEILSKYNFFLYRKANSDLCEKVDSTDSSLVIKDIDGRIWEFKLEGHDV